MQKSNVNIFSNQTKLDIILFNSQSQKVEIKFHNEGTKIPELSKPCIHVFVLKLLNLLKPPNLMNFCESLQNLKAEINFVKIF